MTGMEAYVQLQSAGVRLFSRLGSDQLLARGLSQIEHKALVQVHRDELVRIVQGGAPKVCSRCGLVPDEQALARVCGLDYCLPACLPDGLVYVGHRVTRATVRSMAEAIVAGWAFLAGRVDGVRVTLPGGQADGGELVTKALARAAMYATWDDGRRSSAAMTVLREIETALTAAWDAAGRVSPMEMAR